MQFCNLTVKLTVLAVIYRLFIKVMLFSAAPYSGECEDPYPSLSDYHDYEPNLEFDDSDLHQKHPEGPDGKCILFPYSV